MDTIVLLTLDPSLAELLALELQTAGQALSSVGDGTTPLPKDTLLLFVDLDTVRTFPKESARHTVGITRREALTSPETSIFCTEILHRPFTVTALHSLISQVLPREQKRESTKTRHRVTARRTSKVDAPALRFDPEMGTLLLGADTLTLTGGEATVFRALAAANGDAVSRETLLRLLSAETAGSNLPDVHVCAIRKKLRTYGKDHLIRAVRGVGYAISDTISITIL